MVKSPSTRLIQENASIGYTSKFLQDARYITQSMKLGALGVPAYRTFPLKDIEDATNNFDTSTFLNEGSYKPWLSDITLNVKDQQNDMKGAYHLKSPSEDKDIKDIIYGLLAAKYAEMYRGELMDGSLIAIRCLNMNRRDNSQKFMNHIELLSKLRDNRRHNSQMFSIYLLV